MRAQYCRTSTNESGPDWPGLVPDLIAGSGDTRTRLGWWAGGLVGWWAVSLIARTGLLIVQSRYEENQEGSKSQVIILLILILWGPEGEPPAHINISYHPMIS